MLSSTFDAKYKQVGATKRGSYSDMLFLVTDSVLEQSFHYNMNTSTKLKAGRAKHCFQTLSFEF